MSWFNEDGTNIVIERKVFEIDSEIKLSSEQQLNEKAIQENAIDFDVNLKDFITLMTACGKDKEYVDNMDLYTDNFNKNFYFHKLSMKIGIVIVNCTVGKPEEEKEEVAMPHNYTAKYYV